MRVQILNLLNASESVLDASRRAFLSLLNIVMRACSETFRYIIRHRFIFITVGASYNTPYMPRNSPFISELIHMLQSDIMHVRLFMADLLKLPDSIHSQFPTYAICYIYLRDASWRLEMWKGVWCRTGSSLECPQPRDVQ
jgi:hypothetical protein